MSFNDSFGPPKKDSKILSLEKSNNESSFNEGKKSDNLLKNSKKNLYTVKVNQVLENFDSKNIKFDDPKQSYDPVFPKLIKQKAISDIKFFCFKMDKLFKQRIKFQKLKIFNELKLKIKYMNSLRNNLNRQENKMIKNNDTNKIMNQIHASVNKKCTCYNKGENFEMSHICHFNESEISKELFNFKAENLILFSYEKFLLQKKIKSNFEEIIKNFENHKKITLFKYFTKWVNCSKFGKFYSNLKGEFEKKYSSKFEQKISENSKQIKKLEKEKIELSIKNESLLQSIQVYKLKINTFQEKEKNLSLKLKSLTNEKNKVLSDLQKNEANIDKKISNMENIAKEMENKISQLNETKFEKDHVINSYVDDMNQILDFYEKKTNEFINQLKVKSNNETIDISNRRNEKKERSSSETKLKISSSGQQNFLKSYTNTNSVAFKNSKPLYIKNPYLDGFNTVNPEYKTSNTGKYSNFLGHSYKGKKNK